MEIESNASEITINQALEEKGEEIIKKIIWTPDEVKQKIGDFFGKKLDDYENKFETDLRIVQPYKDNFIQLYHELENLKNEITIFIQKEAEKKTSDKRAWTKGNNPSSIERGLSRSRTPIKTATNFKNTISKEIKTANTKGLLDTTSKLADKSRSRTPLTATKTTAKITKDIADKSPAKIKNNLAVSINKSNNQPTPRINNINCKTVNLQSDKKRNMTPINNKLNKTLEHVQFSNNNNNNPNNNPHMNNHNASDMKKKYVANNNSVETSSFIKDASKTSGRETPVNKENNFNLTSSTELNNNNSSHELALNNEDINNNSQQNLAAVHNTRNSITKQRKSSLPTTRNSVTNGRSESEANNNSTTPSSSNKRSSIETKKDLNVAEEKRSSIARKSIEVKKDIASKPEEKRNSVAKKSIQVKKDEADTSEASKRKSIAQTPEKQEENNENKPNEQVIHINIDNDSLNKYEINEKNACEEQIKISSEARKSLSVATTVVEEIPNAALLENLVDENKDNNDNKDNQLDENDNKNNSKENNENIPCKFLLDFSNKKTCALHLVINSKYCIFIFLKNLLKVVSFFV